MLTNAEVEISAAIVAESATRLEIPGKFEGETGLGTWAEISRATHQPWHPLGHSVQNLTRRVARRHVGNARGKGKLTFIDTYAKVACAKLYDRKTPITAADLLNDQVIPLFDSHDVRLLRVLTDRGSEYCGNPERHEYELYLAIEDIDHSRTKTKSPQTNGICERFHKTVLNEFYRVAFRKKVYCSIDELQADLDVWIREYNEQRPHQGRWCFGKTPMQTFLDAMPMTKEKMIAA
jgi:transposase InsO family protein